MSNTVPMTMISWIIMPILFYYSIVYYWEVVISANLFQMDIDLRQVSEMVISQNISIKLIIIISQSIKYSFLFQQLNKTNNLLRFINNFEISIIIIISRLFTQLIPAYNRFPIMSRHKKLSLDPFHLPQIKRHSINQLQRKKYFVSNGQSILNRFEDQLRVKARKKERMSRLKTLDVNEVESYDSLRRELKSIKQQINFKMQENNHRLQNRFDQYIMLSNFKRDQSPPQVIYQPLPIYMPPMPMYPPQYPQPPPDQSYYDDQYPHQRPFMRKNKKRPTLTMPNRLKLRNFRKAVFAVVFTQRLKRFTQKVINHRKQMFHKYLYDTDQFKQQANQIKKLMIDGLKPFLFALLQKEDTELTLNDGDSENFRKEKVASTKKYFEVMVECFRKIVDLEGFNEIIRSVYYFCRHGSYACLEKMLTLEELENISVSEKHHYLQAEKNLQKSQIINFLFMKILIYNALGQSWKIDPSRFSKDKQTLQQNILLLTSLLYQILMDIQDDYIVNSPQCYPLNNFMNIKGVHIYPAESLTVKPGEFRKNEVVSGLRNQNYIKSTYKLEKNWLKEKIQITEIIDKIHKKMVDYHRRLIKPFF